MTASGEYAANGAGISCPSSGRSTIDSSITGLVPARASAAATRCAVPSWPIRWPVGLWKSGISSASAGADLADDVDAGRRRPASSRPTSLLTRRAPLWRRVAIALG